MPVLFRYCLSSFWPPFLISSLATLLVLNLLYYSLEFFRYLFEYDAGLLNSLLLLVYIQPSHLVLAIPIGFLTAVLVVYGRLGLDKETVAVEAAGFPLTILMWPMILFSGLLSLLLVVFMDLSLPWGNVNFLKLQYKVLTERTAVVVRERVFIKDFEGFELYVDSKDARTGRLAKVTVFLLDERGSVFREIFAQEGSLRQDPSNFHVLLELREGAMQQAGTAKDPSAWEEFYQLRFRSCQLDLSARRAKAGPLDLRGSRNSAGIMELARRIRQAKVQGQDTRTDESDLHKKFSIPFSTLAFAFIGIPLGLLSRAGSFLGPLFAVALVATYDGFLLFGEAGIPRGILSPFWAVWLPNLVLVLVGLILVFRMGNRNFRLVGWAPLRNRTKISKGKARP